MTTRVRVILEPVGPLSADDFLLLESGRCVQVCRARVFEGNVADPYLLVFAHTDATKDITLGTLEPSLSGQALGARAVLVTESSEGQAAAVVASDWHDDLRRVAGSVGVMCASWGWDESPVIAVRVNGTPYFVSPLHDGEHWNAVVADRLGCTPD